MPGPNSSSPPPGQKTTLARVREGSYYNDILIRECKKIELTNLAGTIKPTLVGVGDTFFGLTVTDISTKQFLIDNQWFYGDIVIKFSGELVAKGNVILKGDFGFMEFSE